MGILRCRIFPSTGDERRSARWLSSAFGRWMLQRDGRTPKGGGEEGRASSVGRCSSARPRVHGKKRARRVCFTLHTHFSLEAELHKKGQWRRRRMN